MGRKTTFRFSIAFILFACLCVAGGLAGYRAGFSSGYATGKAKRQAEEPYPEVYYVGDLIRTAGGPGQTEAFRDELDFQNLIGAAQTTVFPSEWESLGGPCTMSPVWHLEALVVHATSGVHEQLGQLFADLSTLETAMAEARQETERRKAARRAWVRQMLEPASARLGTKLTPIPAGFDLSGSWRVERSTAEDRVAVAIYQFVDEDTVEILAAGDTAPPTEAWYYVAPASVVISGKGYTAATTKDDQLVLVPSNDPESFMVATRGQNESLAKSPQ